MTEPVMVLVDYDNVKSRDEKNERDVEANLADLLPRVIAETSNEFGRPSELQLRIYGGWVDEHGRRTRRGEWVLVALSWHRGRSGRTIVKPSLITALACRPGDTLVGTARMTEKGIRQKMVDTMIAIDVMHFARDLMSPVVVFSDDDDLVPAFLAAQAAAGRTRVHWLRRRKVGSGMNDTLVRKAGVTLGSTS